MGQEMTLEEWNHLTKGVWTLKRKDGSSDEPQKKAQTGESSWAMSVWSGSALEPAVIVLSPALSDEAIPLALVQQEGAMEKKKKKRAVGKKVEQKAKIYEEGDLGQEQDFLDDPENVSVDQGHDLLSSIDNDPLPLGVLFKPLIKGLKKEVHQLRKRLKRVEADLQGSQKNAAEVIKEATRLQSLHMKDTASFTIWKENFEKKPAEL
ncbi:hypothetical protein COCNU_scaffold000150G000010 [Cocos nucifera]|nr:hypothetical protein [Cocos nucifera]